LVLKGSVLVKLGDLLREKMEGLSDDSGNNMPLNSGKLVSEMDVDDLISAVVKVTSKRLQETRDGKNFLLLTFEDRSGSIRGVDWGNAILNDERITHGTVIRVEGRVKMFDTNKQIHVKNSRDAITVLSDGEYDPKKFISVTSKDMTKLYQDLLDVIGEIKDEFFKKLLNKMFVEDEKFMVRFLEAPAAVTVHHAYKGGLLEHSLDVVNLARSMRNNYPTMDINDDLVIAGALLHDVGKTSEYRLVNSGIERSTVGELLGHLIVGIEIIHRYAEQVEEFPQDLLTELDHIILSHHGEVDWGAPIQPKTIEAMIVHSADNADSKIAQFREISKKTLNDNNSGMKNQWSEYNKFLSRKIKVKGVAQSYE
jgi:3'-5' exoribonuclease